MALGEGRRVEETRGLAAAGFGARLADGLRRFFDGDLWHSFTRSPVAVVSAVVALVFIGAALFAPLVAPYDPLALSAVALLDSGLPPPWQAGGTPRVSVCPDAQGSDLPPA